MAVPPSLVDGGRLSVLSMERLAPMFQGLQGLQGLQAPKIILSDAQRTILEALQRGTRVAQHFQQRATVVLLAASGQKNKTIAQEMAINHNTMKRWV